MTLDSELEEKARNLEAQAKSAEKNRNFDIAAKLYRQAAEAYDRAGWGIQSETCYKIAETIED